MLKSTLRTVLKLWKISFRAKQEACEEILRENAKRHELVEAGRTFMNALKDLDREEASGIPFIEFKQAFDKVEGRMKHNCIE